MLHRNPPSLGRKGTQGTQSWNRASSHLEPRLSAGKSAVSFPSFPCQPVGGWSSLRPLRSFVANRPHLNSRLSMREPLFVFGQGPVAFPARTGARRAEQEDAAHRQARVPHRLRLTVKTSLVSSPSTAGPDAATNRPTL